MPDLAIIFGGAIGASLLTMPMVGRFSQFQLGTKTAQRLAILLVVLWACLVGGMAILKHLSFNSSAYDLGIFDQMIWNSAHGRLFENFLTPDSPSRLGHHFSPLLLVLVPLYWIYADPISLLAVQALLLALAGLPIFWLARDLLHNNTVALAVLLAYLLHPATSWVALFDFHELALAAPLISTALYLLFRQRYWFFCIALALLFLVKEDMGLVGVGMGIFILLYQRRRLLGLGVAVAGLLWTLILIRYVIPSFRPSGEYLYDILYTLPGSKPQDIITTILSHPVDFVKEMVAPNKELYTEQMFAALGALPLLGWPALLISMPSFFTILLATLLPPEIIRYQYSATLLPSLLTATVLALRWLRERFNALWPTMRPSVSVFVVTSAALGAYFYGPLPMARKFEPRLYSPAPRLEAAQQMIEQIPPEASVVAQSDLVPHLSHRRLIQVFDNADPALRPDYYFLDTASDAIRWPLPQHQDDLYLKAISRVTTDPDYQLVANREGFMLFQHEPNDLARLLPPKVTFGDQITLVGHTIANQKAAAGDTLTLTMYWREEVKQYANYSLFVHLLDRNGEKWGQKDGYPVGEYYPTSEWQPGRVLRYDWSIPIARNAPAGEYRLVAGLYELTTMKRLPVTYAYGASVLGDGSVTLDTFNIAGKPAESP